MGVFTDDYTPKETNQLLADFLKAAQDNMPEGLRNDEEYKEPFKFLCGDRSIFDGTDAIHYKRYTNLLFPAWKAFAPKFCSKPPAYIVKQLTESRRMLAETCQKLFDFKMSKFNYSEMILAVAQDAFFTPCGYGRHSWNKRLGMTVTSRIKPTDVFWDHTAKSPQAAKYVIERHRIKRYEMEKKYGREVAYALNATKDNVAIRCPEGRNDKYPEGKHPYDEVEYFMFWSKIEGYNRVFPFFEEWPEQLGDQWIKKSDVDGLPGEPWPLNFDEDEWHLTQLRLSSINGRIGGLSTFQAAKGSYLQFQDLSGAQARASEESAKKVMIYPRELGITMEKVRVAGGTLTMVEYDRNRAGINNVRDQVQLIEFPGPDEHLITATNLAEQRFGEITGANAAVNQQAAKVETAVEARTLESEANNRIADDQGAVERWVTTIGKKELACDLMRMPRRSTIRVNRSEMEGEFVFDNTPQTIHDVPYEEAVQLEKRVADPDAAMEQIEARDSKKSEMILGGAPEEQIEQTANSMPMDPEVRARSNRKIGMKDKVEIVTPGVEQFVGPELSQYWIEGMTRRQIEAELLVTIQLGSSTSAGRSQQVNEVLMIAKLLDPIYRQFELWDKVAFIYNAIIDASELENLKDAKLNGQDLAAKNAEIQQRQSQAADQQFQQQMALKGAPQTMDPNVERKASSEEYKTDGAVRKQELQNQEAQIKAADAAARDRSKSNSQLIAAMNGAM